MRIQLNNSNKLPFFLFFRQVIEGTKVLRQLEEQNTYNERPIKACKIEDCGLFNLDRNIPYPDD